MTIKRLVSLGLFAALGAGLGCGQGAPDTGTEAVQGVSSDLTIPKKDRIEGFVEKELYVPKEGQPQDPNLVNAWGLVFGPDGLGWIASNGAGKIVAYDSAGILQHQITIPSPTGDKTAEEPPAPTGIVWNFNRHAFKGEDLIAVTEGGTVVSADRHDEEAKIRWASDAVYKGCAIAERHGKPALFATDFVGGKIDVFDDDFHPIKTRGKFVDNKMEKDFEPFNIMAVDGDKLLVTYALRDGDDDKAGAGNGFLDLFDTDGHLIARLISHGALNSPWGLAFAPEKGEKHSVDLLVGNFGDGRVNVYDISIKKGRFDVDFEGALGDEETGKPVVIEPFEEGKPAGLWALVFGNDKGGFEAEDLYFTAGPNDEEDGEFGELSFSGPRK